MFAGVGTRFWIRNLPDAQDSAGDFVRGYQETWWTFYPYVGIETRRTIKNSVEAYGRGRVGLIAVTYEHLTWREATLFPGPGVTAQGELGIRGPRAFLSGYFELMTFAQSGVARGLLQPDSLMLTVGLKAGFSF